jgi:hypothetical protein
LKNSSQRDRKYPAASPAQCFCCIIDDIPVNLWSIDSLRTSEDDLISGIELVEVGLLFGCGPAPSRFYPSAELEGFIRSEEGVLVPNQL